MSPSPEAGTHFPALVLTLAEPHPGGLADRMRGALRARFGAGAAVRAADLGDLRLADVLRGGAGTIDPRALERWLAAELREVLHRHTGFHPARPTLPVLLVADADDPRGRERLVACIEPAGVAVERLGLPAGLSARVVAVAGWPARDPLPMEAAARAAWLRDVEHLATGGPPECVVVVGRSNYRPDRARTWLSLLDDPARDAVLVDQVALLLSTGVLEAARSLGRGRARSPWMALGSAPEEDGEVPWPWVTASDGDWGGWFPSPVCWRVGGDGRQASPHPKLEGCAARALHVSCLAGMPLRFVTGYVEWEAAYRRFDAVTRRRLHRLAEACPAVVDLPPPELATPEIVEEEMVP